VTLPDVPFLAEALDRTLSVVRPERIVLFGSWARGDAGPDSDLDLLVVTAFEGARSQTAIAILKALADLPVPTDAAVLRPDEWERWRGVPGTVAYPADQEGVVLYEA
jgi:predicted nucleotidyltransferase